MAKNFKTGLIITGDADGGVRAVRATSSEIRKLNKDFESGSKRARSYGRETRETARELEFLKQHALGVGTAIAGAFAANNLAQQAVMIRNTDALANSLQVSTKTLQEWQFAGRSVGLEADKIGDIFKDVSDKLGDFAATGGGEAKDLIENLNLNVRELLALSPDKQILRIADAINEIEDPSQRSFYFESLADEMVRLQPLLANGAQGLREASDMADALGIAMDDIEVRRAVEAAEAMDQLHGVAQGLSNTLIADLGPGLAASTRDLTEFIDEVGGADELLEGVGQTIAMLGGVYLAVRLRKPLSKIGPLGLAAGRNIAQGFTMAVGASGRLNQALVVTQGRIAATAAAGRALRSSLALIGGPAGAALLAAGGIYTFREELGLTIPRADASSEAVHQLTGELNDLNKAAAEKKLTELNNRLADLKASAEETGQAYLEVGKNDTGHGGALGADVWGQVSEIQEIGEGAKESRQELANVEEAIGLVRDRLEHLNSTGERTPPVFTEIGDASEEAAKRAEQYADNLRSLLDELNPVEKSQREFRQSQILLQTALLKGSITVEEYFRNLQKLENSYRNAGNAAEVYGFDGNKAMEKVEDSVGPMVKTWERGLERMDDAGVDFWRGLLDGSTNAMDSLEDIVLNGVAEIAHNLTTRKLIVPIQAAITGEGQAGGGLFGGSGSGGLGDIGSLGKTLYNGVVDGFGAVNWMGNPTGYSGGFAGSATAGMGQSGFMGGSLSNFGGTTGLASAGAGLVGNWAGNALFDGGQTSQHLGTLGAGIGTFFGGPIGAGIGSFIGQGVGSLFSDKYAGEDPTGLIATRNQYGQAGRSGWERDAFATGALGDIGFAPDSRDIDTLFGDRDNFESAKKYAEQLAQLDNTVAQLAESEAELNALREAAADQGLTSMSDIEGRYTAILGTLDGEFGEFVQGLDGSIEEVVQRGVTARQAFTALSDASERLDLRFDDTTASAYEAASSLAEMAGGTQQLTSLQQNYYQTLYSEEERLNQLRSDVTQQLNAMGMSLPRSRDGFRELVEAQDLNTEAGQRNYTQLLQLVDGFDRLADSGALVNAEVAKLDDQIASLKDDVKSAWETFDKQQLDQRVQLLELAGESEQALSLQRERELEAMDASLRPFQERYWALQDEKEAQEEAAQAGREYAEALASARDSLGSTFDNISSYLDQLRSTDKGGGTPREQLTAARSAFNEQLQLARSGDRTALQNITQYADRLIDAQRGWSASGGATSNIIERIENQLGNLPDQVSAEEYIADEIKQALIEQTAGITSQLADVLRSDTPSNIAQQLAGAFDDLTRGIGDVLTREQLATVMDGKASDAQLDAIMRAVDLNGDGVMSGLESVIIKSMPTDATLANALQNQLEANGNKALTADQVRQALSPIASNERINQLITRLDVNGDGLLSAQEITSARIGGLSGSIAQSLSGYFDELDANLDGKLTFDELSKGLDGLATDAQLRAMMQSMDLNADGVISGLESVIISEMPTDARLTNVLRNQMERSRNQSLSYAEVREALSPIASKAIINRLINKADRNADGVITAQELNSLRIGELTDSVISTLDTSFDQLDANLDGKLTFKELQAGLDGMATNSQLRAMMRASDINANGVISGLEAVVIKSMPTDARLTNVLRNQLERSRNQSLSYSEVREALNPIASKAVINRLINRADVNADGIITAQELANARLDGLASGIGGALSPMFDQIDTSLDGLINYDEFGKQLEGMASDKQLRQIFDQLDTNGDGAISRLEALKHSSDEVGDNTKSIEERALDQVSKLGDLVTDMTASTNQLVSLDSSVSDLAGVIGELNALQQQRAQEERQHERKMAQMAYYNTRQAAGEKLIEQMETNQSEMASARESLTQNQIQHLAGFVGNNQAQGPTAGMDQEDWERIRDNIQSNDNMSRAAKQFVLNMAAYRLRRGRLNEWEAIVGGHEFSPDSLELSGYAQGGYTGPGGKYDVAGLVHAGEVVWSQSDVARAGGVGAVESLRQHGLDMSAPSVSLSAPPIPALPLLGESDIAETLQDLRREVAGLRAENKRLLGESNEHLGAANRQRGAAAKRQIEEQQRGNEALERMSSESQLVEASR